MGSRAGRITSMFIFGRVASLLWQLGVAFTGEVGQNFLEGHLGDVSVDVLVLMSEIDGEGRITA